MNVAQADLDAVADQLGRPPRGILEVVSRCPSGHPNVVKTEPRLDDGTPFPTLFYITCPRLAGEIGTLEASGLMREMSARLAQDETLSKAYQEAHHAYLAERQTIGHVPEIEGVSAGGMPTRVKCLHALVAHSLARGPAANPLGDETLALLGSWWDGTACGPARHVTAAPHPMSEDSARVAAIDCGTNTIRLLVSDVHDDDTKTDLVREMRVVRLGEGVDSSGHLSAAAIDRAVQATGEYADLLARFGVVRVRFCATSAVRDADNAAGFEEAINAVLGVRPTVLSGLDEARASFLGATHDLEPVRTMVVDIGGGSTEIVVGAGREIEWSTSLDVGSVRLSERFLHSDPPSTAEITACTEHLDAILTPVAAELGPVQSVVGVAGTVTTVAAHALGLESYDSARIDRARLSLQDVRAACHSLVQMTVGERRALPFMHPGRADVIGAGALILLRLVELLPPATESLVVSEHDILDGIVWNMATEGA